MNTQLFVERDNSLPGAMLAAFAPFGAVVRSTQIAAEGQVGP